MIFWYLIKKKQVQHIILYIAFKYNHGSEQLFLMYENYKDVNL